MIKTDWNKIGLTATVMNYGKTYSTHPTMYNAYGDRFDSSKFRKGKSGKIIGYFMEVGARVVVLENSNGIVTAIGVKGIEIQDGNKPKLTMEKKYDLTEEPFYSMVVGFTKLEDYLKFYDMFSNWVHGATTKKTIIRNLENGDKVWIRLNNSNREYDREYYEKSSDNSKTILTFEEFMLRYGNGVLINPLSSGMQIIKPKTFDFTIKPI